jgi:hypothetical protein
MSYGYDASFALSSSVSDIETGAASLLNYLNGARLSTEEKERSIIFVCSQPWWDRCEKSKSVS